LLQFLNIPHYPTRGLGERRKLPIGVRGCCKWIWCIFHVTRKPSGTSFSVFLSDGRTPPNVAGPGKTFPLPSLDGPGHSFHYECSFYFLHAVQSCCCLKFHTVLCKFYSKRTLLFCFAIQAEAVVDMIGFPEFIRNATALDERYKKVSFFSQRY